MIVYSIARISIYDRRVRDRVDMKAYTTHENKERPPKNWALRRRHYGSRSSVHPRDVLNNKNRTANTAAYSLFNLWFSSC